MTGASEASHPRVRHADAICTACTAGVSVVCMSSMAAALAATGAAAGAGAAGMGGMASMSGAALSIIPGLFDALGLGALNHLPNDVLQPLLVVFLTLSVVATYIASRSHGRPRPLLVSVVSAILMYVSIYVVMSDALYLLSLTGLLGAALWGIVLGRRTRRLLPGAR